MFQICVCLCVLFLVQYLRIFAPSVRVVPQGSGFFFWFSPSQKVIITDAASSYERDTWFAVMPGSRIVYFLECPFRSDARN